MKGHKLNTSTIVAFVILLVSVLIMFILLNFVAKEKRAKSNDLTPSTTETEKTTTTLEVKTNESDNHYINADDEEKAQNFSTSLADIINARKLSGDYSINAVYKGAKFNFKCTATSEDKKKCTSGSATIDIDGVVLPLYTFDNEGGDYSTNLLDYYIMNNDKYIILTYNNAGKAPGEIKVYGKSGNLVTSIKNVITGYIENGDVDRQYYPIYSAEDNTIAYYLCRNNQVKVNKVNIDNAGAVLLEENIDGVRCY